MYGILYCRHHHAVATKTKTKRPREVISAASSGAVKAPELANSVTCKAKPRRSRCQLHWPLTKAAPRLPLPTSPELCWEVAARSLWHYDGLPSLTCWSSLKPVEAGWSSFLWKLGGVGPSNERALLKSRGHCLSFCKLGRPKCRLDKSFLVLKESTGSEYIWVFLASCWKPNPPVQNLSKNCIGFTHVDTWLGNLSVPRRKPCSCLL